MRKLLTKIKLCIKQWACEHEVQHLERYNEGYKIGCSNSTVWLCCSCNKEILTNGLEKKICKNEGTLIRVWNSSVGCFVIKEGCII